MLALAFLAGSIWYRQAEIPNVGEPFDVRAFTASIPGPEHNKAPEAIKDALLKSQERVMEADFKLGPPNPIRLKPHPPSDTARAQGQAAEGQAAAAVPAEVFDALGGEPEIPAKDYFELIDYVLNDDFPVDDPQLGKWLDEVFQIEEMKHLREAIPLPLGVFIDPRTEWMKHLRKAVQLPLAVFIDPRTADVLSDRRIEHPGYLAAKAILGRALQLQSRKKDAEALDHIMTVLALSRHFRNMADTSSYLLALTIEKWAVEVLDRWVRQLGSNPDLLRRALDELTRHQARIPPNDFLKTDYLKSRHNLNDIHIRHALILPGIKVQPAEKSLFQDVLEFAWQVPWEKNRLERIQNLLFAGWLRGIEVDYSELLDQKFDMNQRRESQAWPLLRNWLPPQPGPASSWTRERLGDVVDESVLGKFLQYSPVNARMYSDFRDAYREGTRLQLALMLYQYENKKPAPSLKALVPKYFPELPKDPFSGQSFHYRVSAGELISQTYNTEPIRVPAGQGILWSVGPDGIDNRGTKQGAPSSSMDPSVWNRGGFDLIFLVPPWPKEKQ